MIDGDLCELYNSLEPARKQAIADDLDRTPNEVCVFVPLLCVLTVGFPLGQVAKKLEDLRTRYAF